MSQKLSDLWCAFDDWRWHTWLNLKFFEYKLLWLAFKEILSGRFTIWDMNIWEYLLADHPSSTKLLCRIAGHPYSTYHRWDNIHEPPDETPLCMNCEDESWGFNRPDPWWKSLTPHG